ncbi:MAG: ABC transporter substrate-binding protein [Thermogemmatispora sp.]|uniref:ABC transporter substrate-binding protein n=1 Tax=Thermogemmatispora sp. TaxID=1968838 RepID=UPI001A047887|nr:ABC transporter substrate-binding protein [Thermogemmatispora sp.]MBE3567814.1 ABC transporter substrate-binding protein [Thermogemmatispora sp.]
MRCPQCHFEGEPLNGGCPRCGYGRLPDRGSRPLSSGQESRELVTTVSRPLSLVATRPVLRGDVLREGRYRIVEELPLPRSQYDQGKAWLARDAQSVSRLVLIREVIPTAEKAARLEQELRMTAQRLAELGQHRGFPHLIDMFSERGCYYIVLQHPEGQSLTQLVEQQEEPLPERLVAEYGRQLCELVQVLASQEPPLVHGAISPETVIISPDGRQVSLILMPLFPPRLPPEMQGKAIAGFFAPEQFHGVTDTRTDLYGVAATLYYALTTYDPRQHMAFFYPPIRRLNPRVSARMEAALARGLRVAAAQRYLRPAQMLQELAAIAAASPRRGGEEALLSPSTEALPPGRARPRRRSGTRRSTLTFAAVMLLVFALLVGGIIVAAQRAPQSTGVPNPAATATSLAQQTATAQQARLAAAAWQQELNHEQQSWQTRGIAVSDGRFVLDSYAGRKDVEQKQAAARALQTGDLDTAASALSSAIALDPTDAEALIYSQNLLIEQNGQPFVTIVVGLSFNPNDPQSLAATRSMLQGIYVAQYEINEFAWLPHNYQLRILIAGSPPDKASVTEVAHDIVNRVTQADNLDHIIGVVGWPSSSQTQAVRDLIASAHLPLVSQLAPDVNLVGNPYFFRISPPYNVQGDALAEFALQQLHANAILVMRSPTDAASTALANAFEARVQVLNGHVVDSARDTFVTQTTPVEGYSTAIADALAHQANVIFLAGTDVDAVRLAHEIGLLSRAQPANTALANLKVLAGPAVATRLLLGEGDSEDALLARSFPEDMQRIYVLAYADPSEWNNVPSLEQPTLFTDWAGIFQNQKESANNAPPPDQNAIMTYDAVRVIARAASYVKGSLNGANVRSMLDALGNGPLPAFDGASGRISFDSLGNPSDKALVMLQVRQDETTGASTFAMIRLFGALH